MLWESFLTSLRRWLGLPTMEIIRQRRPRCRVVFLEELETRVVPAGTWTPLNNLAPATIGSMELMSDGTVLAQQVGSTSLGGPNWSISPNGYKLIPSVNNGSYINGTWSANVAPMSESRWYGGSVVLRDGRLLYMGGIYTANTPATGHDNTGEIYDPVTNTWSPAAPFPEDPGQTDEFADQALELLPDGTVFAGNRDNGKTYIYHPGTQDSDPGYWSDAAPKPRDGSSQDSFYEETLVKMGGDKILMYDVNSSNASGNSYAQYYDPASNTWSPTGAVNTNLSDSAGEIGPGVLLPGRPRIVGPLARISLIMTAHRGPRCNSVASNAPRACYRAATSLLRQVLV